MQIHVMQHADDEGLGTISEWGAQHDVEFIMHHPNGGDAIQLLNPAELDGLLILGGPQSVNDADGWLAAERILIRSLAKLGRPVFGVCLGAQQIVRAFGAAVSPLPQGEYGRQLVTSASGEALPVFQWHGEALSDLPGSTVLYSNAVQHNQAFTYHDRITGIQFHLEWPVAQQQMLLLSEPHPGAATLTLAEAGAAEKVLAALLTQTFL